MLFAFPISNGMNYFKIAKFFLILPVLSVAIVSTSTLFPFIVGKYVWFRTSVALATIFFLLGILLNPNEFAHLRVGERLKNPLVIAVGTFVALFLLAGFFGVDPAMSFWSNFERGEGGLQMMFLFLFFVLLIALFREEKDWRRIFGWSLVGAVLMIFYGIGAGIKSIDIAQGGPLSQTFANFVGDSFTTPGFRFMGSIGNPAYVATYLVFIFFYLAYLFVTKYRSRLFSAGALAYYALALFFAVFFVLAATRGAFVGLAVAAVAFLAYIAYSNLRLRKILLGSALALVILLILLVVFRNVPFLERIPGYSNFSRLFDISFSAKTFQDRTTIWKMAWDGFKARPLLGWGPENFIYVFDTHFNPAYFKPAEGFGAWFDRAHSIFFDYLAETGILGLMSFLGIFVAYYYQFTKKWIVHKIYHVKKAEVLEQRSRSLVLEGIMFVLLIAYLVQGLVLFDIFVTYLNLFLFFAFSVYQFQKSYQAL